MDHFPRYESFSPANPVHILASGRRGCFHRFFDTTPFSPSGRYVCLFQAPFEDRVNQPGDVGAIVVIDLETGKDHEVATTRGWEFQMGANLQWGSDDKTLLFNDVDIDTWTSHGVRLDWTTGARSTFPRGIYHASPDGQTAAVTNPVTMRRTQKGYGVVIPDEMVPLNTGLPDDDGLFITDVESGTSDLVVPIRKLVLDGVPREEQAEYEAMENYAFHCKWNSTGDRLILTLRRKPVTLGEPFGVRNHKDLWFDVFTCRPDGSDIHRAVPWTEWKKGGHHINFFPNADKLSMNVNLDGAGMVLMEVSIDGSDYRPITRAVPGSGHPTVVPNGRNILTDTYAGELSSLRPATVPDDYNQIRWIDYQAGTETPLVWIPTRTPGQQYDSVLRVDPHPAWSRDWSRVIVNAFLDGTRRPLVIDMSGMGATTIQEAP